MTVRDDLVTELQRIVGDTAHVFPYEDNRDTPDERVTIMVKQRRIGRLPAAPNGRLRYGYVLTVAAPATNPAVAEPILDDYVPMLIAELLKHTWLSLDDDAEKTLDGSYLGYDLPISVFNEPTGLTQGGLT